MALVKSIEIGIGVNTKELTKGLKKASDDLARFKSAALAFGSGAAGAFAAIGASSAFSALTSGIGQAIEAGSDLNEQLSKSAVVFGESAGKVEDEARAMGDAFGYPISQFMDAASSIGLIAKASGLSEEAAADMSVEFAKLGADASSFFNVDLEEALMAIRSGLTGEAEPMRRFGVLLNEAAVKAEAARLGIAKVGDELTEGQKVQARSSLIMKGMADAQGDLARTSDSVSNRIRSLQGRWTNALAEMGEIITPLTESLLGLADDGMGNLTKAVNANASAWKAWAQVAGDAISQFSLSYFTTLGPVLGLGANLAGMAMGPQMKALQRANAPVVKPKVPAAKPPAPTVDKAAEKRAKQIKDLDANLRVEIATYGQAGHAAELMKLRLDGATEAQLANVSVMAKYVDALERQKQANEDAKQVFDATRTPLEKYRMEIQRLEKLRAAGFLSNQTFGRAELAARRDLQGGKEAQSALAGAYLGGSAEAFSLQARLVAGATGDQGPLREVAETNREQVDISKQMLTSLNKLVDRGIGKLAGAAAEVFTL